jgi:3-oxoacyl-[acyl-carrier-protein] synthase-3
MGSDGGKADLLCMPGGGSRIPATPESVASRLHFLRMDGRETFKNAVVAMCRAAHQALEACALTIDQVACVIPHQANRRIIEAVTERLGAVPQRVFVNVDRYGNTSAASVAIALDEAVREGRIARGDLLLLLVFGAGLTWGAAVIEW